MFLPGIMIGMRTFVFALLLLASNLAHAYTVPTAAVYPAGGNLPADRVKLLYYPSQIDDEPRLYRLEGTTKVNVAYESTEEGDAIWIEPTIEQPLGTQLVLESGELRVTYSITERRPANEQPRGRVRARSADAGVQALDAGDAPTAAASCALAHDASPTWLALLLLTLLRRRARA